MARACRRAVEPTTLVDRAIMRSGRSRSGQFPTIDAKSGVRQGPARYPRSAAFVVPDALAFALEVSLGHELCAHEVERRIDRNAFGSIEGVAEFAREDFGGVERGELLG